VSGFKSIKDRVKGLVGSVAANAQGGLPASLPSGGLGGLASKFMR